MRRARAGFLGAIAGLLAGTLMSASVLVAPASAAVPESGRLEFEVLRNGDPLGRHILTFEERGDELFVDVDVELKVRIGPITPFFYAHDVREEWEDGNLVSLRSTTRKDGRDFRVEATRTADGKLAVASTEFTGEVPGDVPPSTWWNNAVLERGQILSTESGKAIPAEATFIGRETIIAEGQEIEANRWRMVSELTIDLWYDDAGRWVKCQFEARGSTIEYVLVAGA